MLFFQRFTTEYEIKELTTSLKIDKENCSMASVRIPLQRRFSYYITSAYLPTTMLVILGYASLFCKIDNIDLRVMMAVTILIVLYTLYQQISDGLPKTSYSKAIDVWYFFSLVFIFTLVMNDFNCQHHLIILFFTDHFSCPLGHTFFKGTQVR